MSTQFRTLVTALVILASGAGLYASALRHRVEARNRRVEICVDLREVESLSQWGKVPLAETLSKLKTSGATSVAIAEDTVAELVDRGAVIVNPSAPGVVTLTSPHSDSVDRIIDALVVQSQLYVPNSGPFEAGCVLQGRSRAELTQLTLAQLRELGIGLKPAPVQAVQQAGMIPIGRLKNPQHATQEQMGEKLRPLASLGIRTAIFDGLEVLGYRGYAKEAAEAFNQTGLIYGSVEFGKQKGDAGLSRALKDRYVRVHSISDAEMGTLDLYEAVDRFVKAARERNIRICYVRLPHNTGPDPLGENGAFLSAIVRGITRTAGMATGQSKLFDDPQIPMWCVALMAVGVAAGLKALALKTIPLPEWAWWLKLMAESALIAGLAVAGGNLGRQLVALLAALVFPTLACVRGNRIIGHEFDPVARRGGAILKSAKVIVAMSAVSALGGLLIAGLLATPTFLIKTEQFAGIKAAHALPLFMVGALFLTGLPAPAQALSEYLSAVRANLRRAGNEPVRLGMMAAAAVGLVMLAMIVARTGNEPGVGVSGLELKFRSLLDSWLPARPRTKEFLLGHPAMMLSLCLWFSGNRKWAAPLYLIGVIGQVSLLNTFCHLHTPLYLTAVRAATGLVFGCLIGLAAFLVIDWAVSQSSRNRQVGQLPLEGMDGRSP